MKGKNEGGVSRNKYTETDSMSQTDRRVDTEPVKKR